MPFGDLVVIRTFLNLVEAEVAASALDAAGIRHTINKDDCGGLRPTLWLSGVQLLVRPEDVTAATEILEAPTLTSYEGP
ncbi:MAG: putative signal transducing protein [Vicinamibacterales bacterium]